MDRKAKEYGMDMWQFYVEKVTYTYNGLNNPYWGVIRPAETHMGHSEKRRWLSGLPFYIKKREI